MSAQQQHPLDGSRPKDVGQRRFRVVHGDGGTNYDGTDEAKAKATVAWFRDHPDAAVRDRKAKVQTGVIVWEDVDGV